MSGLEEWLFGEVFQWFLLVDVRECRMRRCDGGERNRIVCGRKENRKREKRCDTD